MVLDYSVSIMKIYGINIMTTPRERKTAVMNTEKFLLRLMDPKQTPRVPKAIRQEARGLLKHYPSEYYVEESV